MAAQLPAVRSRLAGSERVPPALREMVGRLPNGSPLAAVGAIGAVAILSGAWLSVWYGLNNPGEAAVFYGGALFLAYVYVVLTESEDTPEDGMVSDRTRRGKVGLAVALIPGAFLGIVLALGLVIAAGTAAHLLFIDPVPGIAIFVLCLAVPFYLGGHLRDRADGRGPIDAAGRRLSGLWRYRLVRDAATIAPGIIQSALSFVMVVVGAALAVAVVVGVLRSPLLLFGLVGLALAYFGFAVHEALLAFLGGILGLVAGFVAGLSMLPDLLAPELGLAGRLGLAIVAASVGSAVGQRALPVVHRLGIRAAGFLVAAVPTFVLLAGFPSRLGPGGVLAAVVAALVGLVGAAVAGVAYVAYVVLVTSFLGGLVVGTLAGSIPVGVAVFATGAGFQWLSASAVGETGQPSATAGSAGETG